MKCQNINGWLAARLFYAAKVIGIIAFGNDPVILFNAIVELAPGAMPVDFVDQPGMGSGVASVKDDLHLLTFVECRQGMMSVNRTQVMLVMNHANSIDAIA